MFGLRRCLQHRTIYVRSASYSDHSHSISRGFHNRNGDVTYEENSSSTRSKITLCNGYGWYSGNGHIHRKERVPAFNGPTPKLWMELYFGLDWSCWILACSGGPQTNGKGGGCRSIACIVSYREGIISGIAHRFHNIDLKWISYDVQLF